MHLLRELQDRAKSDWDLEHSISETPSTQRCRALSPQTNDPVTMHVGMAWRSSKGSNSLTRAKLADKESFYGAARPGTKRSFAIGQLIGSAASFDQAGIQMPGPHAASIHGTQYRRLALSTLRTPCMSCDRFEEKTHPRPTTQRQLILRRRRSGRKP